MDGANLVLYTGEVSSLNTSYAEVSPHLQLSPDFG